MLTIDEVSVRFGGVRALDRVSLSASRGERVAIIGPNGAGKSTALNVVSGFVRPDSGQVRFDGMDITSARAHRRARLGIGRSFQTPRLVPGLTLRQTLQVCSRYGARRRSDEMSVDRVAELARVGGLLDVDSTRLTLLERRMAEVARALSLRPSVLLLDEPATGLRAEEVDSLAEVLVDASAQLSLALLVVSHDIELVEQLCSRVVVFDFGVVVANGTPREIRNNPEVVASYFGTADT
jgi:branched-chain amino acid transport system ATP-binding protein